MKELLKTELGPYDIDQFLDIFHEFITTHVLTEACGVHMEVCYPLPRTTASVLIKH